MIDFSPGLSTHDHTSFMKTDKDLNKDSFMQQSKGFRSTGKRIVDNTSEHEIMRAMSTYLNRVGPGQHNMPNLTGRNNTLSKMHNSPSFTFRAKVTQPFFKGREVDFVGRASPPATKYSHQKDAPYKTFKFSVKKAKRFQ